MADFKAIMEALVAMDEKRVLELVQKALDEGVEAKVILNEGLIPGMDIVGEKMESGEMFIPEVLMSAKAMSAAVDILKPFLGAAEAAGAGKVVMGTVKGDLHDIGKNLVIMMLESAGFEVVNLGVDVSPEDFIEAIEAHQPQIVGLSALLTTTMKMMRETIDVVLKEGYRDQVKIMVGGAPVNQDFANSIGADGYAPDAGSAVRMAKSLLAR